MANPNPDTSGLAPFPKGVSGNPGGKTAAQRAAEVEAAELGALLRLQMLRGVLKSVSDDAGQVDPAQAAALIGPDLLRLIKDSEDRAHGTPKASTEVSGPEGAPLFEGVKVTWAKPDAGA